MGYLVKTIYYSLQGEGFHVGRPAVFCRFSGCNLWTGREKDRRNAICGFCDTDFVGTNGPGGGRFDDATALTESILKAWVGSDQDLSRKLVVCTGGEPLLQLDAPLVDALHEKGFAVAIETNGTQMPPEGVDWICVSPKSRADLVLRHGNELKLVFPQEGIAPDGLLMLDFQHFFLQPLDGGDRKKNTDLVIDYCLKHPQWRVSLQTHKYLGIS